MGSTQLNTPLPIHNRFIINILPKKKKRRKEEKKGRPIYTYALFFSGQTLFTRSQPTTQETAAFQPGVSETSSIVYTHTVHSHTHTQEERERERVEMAKRKRRRGRSA